MTVTTGTNNELVRGIGRWGLTAFALNLTVGSGIMGLPAKLQAIVGNYSFVVIGLCGLMIALIALCFAEIGSRFERTGGPQLYASIAMGPTMGFTVGWLLWISRLGTCAAVSNLLIDYGRVLLPVLAQPVARAITITLLVTAYMFINIRGIRQTSAVNTVFTVAKLAPLFLFAVVGIFFIEPHALQLGPMPTVADLSTAILLATFAFFGFDSTTILAGEVRDPQRSVPFAILLSVSIVIVLYTVIQIVCVGTLPGPATSERPLSDAAVLFAGPWASTAVAVTAVIACAGVYGASITPATRLLFSIADQQQLPAVLAKINGRMRTPVAAIVVSTLAAWVLALSGSFIYLVKITLIARVTIYAITCLTLPLFRRRNDVPKAAISIPGASVIACACTILCVLFLVKSSMRELLDVGLGVLVGLVILGLTRRLSRSPAL